MTPPKPFWVMASNIQTGESQEYGPYPGPPGLTYELLRALGDEDQPAHIFMWIDPQDIGEGNPHGYESWQGYIDEEGEDGAKYFGWREVRNVVTRRYPDGLPYLSHEEPVGPFWTDLAICDQKHPHD